jgi:predicted RNA polymerase sigma factor
VPESTIGQRISRAKQSIKTSRIPPVCPTLANARTPGVGAVRAVSDLQRGIRRARGGLHRTDLSNKRCAPRATCTRCCRTTETLAGCSR